MRSPWMKRRIAQFVRDEKIGLVGIGAMTRMVAKAYRMADAVRAAGVPVVMGGPHVTEEPDEALGRNGGPRHADAVALGEADETWPKIVADAARGQLREIYEPVDEFGQERKPTLQSYPVDSVGIHGSRPVQHRSQGHGSAASGAWAGDGRRFALFRWSPGAAVLMAANFAPSPAFSAIPSAFAAMKAWWMNCCD